MPGKGQWACSQPIENPQFNLFLWAIDFPVKASGSPVKASFWIRRLGTPVKASG